MHDIHLFCNASTGKYGAGLSLEVLGKCLSELHIPKDRVIISNKLGRSCTNRIYIIQSYSKIATIFIKVDIINNYKLLINEDGIVSHLLPLNQLLNQAFGKIFNTMQYKK